MNPMRPLPDGWEPSPEKWTSLQGEFGGVLDLSVSLRRFRNHYCEGQTSRNWDAKFENWVLSDAGRTGLLDGTDDLGVPHNQRTVSRYRTPTPEETEAELAELARLATGSTVEREEQP